MFAAMKGGEGMIAMWMQSVETFHRWLTIVQIGRALIQMLAVKADTATTVLAQYTAFGKPRSGIKLCEIALKIMDDDYNPYINGLIYQSMSQAYDKFGNRKEAIANMSEAYHYFCNAGTFHTERANKQLQK
jgi:hypothetical protein